MVACSGRAVARRAMTLVPPDTRLTATSRQAGRSAGNGSPSIDKFGALAQNTSGASPDNYL